MIVTMQIREQGKVSDNDHVWRSDGLRQRTAHVTINIMYRTKLSVEVIREQKAEHGWYVRPAPEYTKFRSTMLRDQKNSILSVQRLLFPSSS